MTTPRELDKNDRALMDNFKRAIEHWVRFVEAEEGWIDSFTPWNSTGGAKAQEARMARFVWFKGVNGQDIAVNPTFVVWVKSSSLTPQPVALTDLYVLDSVVVTVQGEMSAVVEALGD